MLFPEQKYEIVTFGKDCSSKKTEKNNGVGLNLVTGKIRMVKLKIKNGSKNFGTE